MRPYEQLDAFQTCRALTLAVWRIAEPLDRTEPQLAQRLRYVVLRATGRIAFGSGTGDGCMFRTALWRADGFIAEAGCLLDLLRVMSCLPEASWQELDQLRSRASFYLSKLVMEGLGPAELPDLPWDDGDDLEEWQQ